MNRCHKTSQNLTCLPSSMLFNVYIKNLKPCLAWSSNFFFFFFLSTLQMFTMLHVCKILFIRHRRPVLTYSLLWSPHFFYVYLLSLFLFYVLFFFSFSQKKNYPFLLKTVTRLDLTDGMNEWRETNTLQLNMTHKHEHEKKKKAHYRKQKSI